MKVLVIGGNRFMGYLLVWRLVAGGHSVTVMNRGSRGDVFAGAEAVGKAVEVVVGDRKTELGKVRGEWDAVVDFVCFDGGDARGAVEVLGGKCGHYLMVSTGQVYLVREGGIVAPYRESDYEGAVMAGPPTEGDRDSWVYGTGKREAEDVLAAAGDKLASTRIRVPMVNGPLDNLRRIEGYLWRILDGGPVLLPLAGRVCRHVYAWDVARFISEHVGDARLFGRGINLSQVEEPTLWDLVGMMGDRLGRREVWRVRAEAEELGGAGLVLRDVSPFSGRWMSRLDDSVAVGEFGYRATGLGTQLDVIVESFLSHMPKDRPGGYGGRAREVELGRRLG